jgi:trehalose 2-sulfotransferase
VIDQGHPLHSAGVEPVRSYLIASTPRSGSTLLCEALANTGVAGRPDEYYQHRRKTGLPRRPLEYFEDALTPEIADVLGAYSRVDDELSLYDPRRFPEYRAYLDWTIAQGTTPNGVFGAKVMWGYFNGFVDSLRDVHENAVLSTRAVLERTFPGLDRWIFVTRRDKVRQAISLWKAIQNWTWRREDGTGTVIAHDLRYSYDAIGHLAAQLAEQEREWQAWFQEAGIEAFVVVYEDFAQRYEGTAIDILAFLGIDVLPAFGPRRMTRQSDALSDEWAERFRREAAAEGAGAASSVA